MIRCDKCGTFYEELTHNNCPKCGEKKHQSVGHCLLCGKEAERGDVCNKCIKAYEIKSEEIVNGSKEDVLGYKKSKGKDWLQTIAALIICASIMASVALIAASASGGLIIATLFGGMLTALFMFCFAEHLEYMEHMTKQLEEIKEIRKLKK